jgi:phosphatidylinositol alpha-1,6-mannosyltransferase
MRILWVTNDLPPRFGGIEQFVHNLLLRVHPRSTVVFGPARDDAHAHDAHVPYRVVRARGPVRPTRVIRGGIERLVEEHDPAVVVLGAAWPLGELAPWLRDKLDLPAVGLTHGLEAGLCRIGLGFLVRRATRGLGAATTISDFAQDAMGDNLAAARIARIAPGVDAEVFAPSRPGGTDLRARWGVPGDAPLVGCISRLVRRKGQDTLLRVWPAIHAAHPDAWLAIVGTGPFEGTLRDRARALPNAVVTGEVAWNELGDAHAAFNVFAMPCRTRLFGTDVEGLGIVYLEAQACGVPVVSGRSGGAPEAVRDGETGMVVDGRDEREVTAAVTLLLGDADLRRRMGDAGRDWVLQRWTWDGIAARFERLLDEVVAAPR